MCVLLALSLIEQRALLWTLAEHVPHDLGDPLLTTWIFWWNASHAPLTADTGTPGVRARAQCAGAVGNAARADWITTPAQWLGASPVAAHNLIYLLTPLLNGLSAYWLCLTLT